VAENLRTARTTVNLRRPVAMGPWKSARSLPRNEPGGMSCWPPTTIWVRGWWVKRCVIWAGNWAALVGWSSAAYKSGPRDRWLGWSEAQRHQRLPLVANNARFLVLPEGRRPNLASMVLARTVRRLSADWETAYGHGVVLAETFVDPTRFRGTCYRAAGWEVLGKTRGFARHAGRYRADSYPKLALVYPLHGQAAELLSATFVSPELPVHPRPLLDLNRVDWEGLRTDLSQLDDPRDPRGRRHRHGVVVCLGVMGWLAGRGSYRGLGRWVADLPQPVLERVGCVRDGRAGRWQPPSETTLRRHLQATEPQALHQAVHRWLAGEARRVPRVVQAAQATWARTPDLAVALGVRR